MRFSILWLIYCLMFLASFLYGESKEPESIKDKVSNWFKEKFSSFEKEVKIQYGLYLHESKSWSKVTESIDSDRVILLVHGLDDPGILWDELAEHLGEKKIPILRLSYPNDQEIPKSTSFLNDQLKVIKTLGVENVVIIAHSMGGLITRDVITHADFYAGDIDGGNSRPGIEKVITVGTPNKGSNFAQLQFLSELGEQLVHLARDEARFLGFFYDGFGEAGEDLMPNSDYLKDLNSRELPEDLDITVIAGNMGLETSKNLEQKFFEWGRGSRFKNEMQKLEDYFKSSANVIGDGVVSIESAKLKGAKDFEIVQGNHISILTSLSTGKYVPGAFPIIFDRLDFVMKKTSSSEIKDDEEVVFYPTHIRFDPDHQEWVMPIHGSIFEPEHDSIWRKMMLKTFSKTLGLTDEESQKTLFKVTAAYFLVDYEGSKTIEINFNHHTYTLERSGSNGHFYGELKIPKDAIEAQDKTILSFRALTQAKDDRDFQGRAQVLSPKGIMVISDIDDTIKVSNVLDKKELLKNTFLKEFKAVTGMSEFYRQLEQHGAAFHYLSSSPWQLYEKLEKFIKQFDFPKGEFTLKFFRLKDRSLLDLMKSPLKTKVPGIQSILSKFPDRKFILIGDSGEKDPEVYAEIAKANPDSVLKICIRKVENDESGADRFERAFEGLPKSLWVVFDDASNLNVEAILTKQ